MCHQKSIRTQIGAKGVRLDVMVEDEAGSFYDVEMQTVNEKNLAKRMRYYQCAIDNSAISKGSDYNTLSDTFIIFLCTFDYLEEGLPVYTIIPSCRETGQPFKDGTVKLIVNSSAAKKAEGELQALLEYMNGEEPKTAFTKKLAQKVQQIKADEKNRREYMLLQSFEMDARRAGIQQGLAQGIQQGKSEGISQGFSDGMRQTARILKQLGDPLQKIVQVTGLSTAEIEAL